MVEIEKGERLVVQILNNLAKKNPKQFATLTDSQKLVHIKKELAKLGLYVDKHSREMQSFENLKRLNDEFNMHLKTLTDSIVYSNNQSKLLRFAHNIDNIVDSYRKISGLLAEYKQNLKPFESLISKYVKKIPTSRTQSAAKYKAATVAAGKNKTRRKRSKR